MGEHTFLSYARTDQAFVSALASELKKRGLSVSMDNLDIVPGDDSGAGY